MALARVSELEQISSRALLGKGVPSGGLALLLPALEQGLPQIFQTKNYQSETGSAGSLRSLLKESAWQTLQESLGFKELSRLQSLACGSFESGVVGDILAWAEGLPSQHLALQLALYEVVENKVGDFSSRAGELRQVALGGGSLKQRLQYNLAHFQDHAMNPATVGGLAAGMWLGAGVRYLSLSRLSQVKGFFSANALGGQSLARGAAFLSEVPGVVVAGKGIRQLSMGTQDWSLNTLTEETARLGLSLLVIKGIAGVAHRSLAMGGTMQAEAVAGSGLFTRVVRATVPHGATGVGIYLAKPAERFVFGGLGLGVGDSGMDAVFETLSFGVAGSLSRAALSPRMNIRLAQWQRRSYEMERGLAQGVLSRLRSMGTKHFSGETEALSQNFWAFAVQGASGKSIISPVIQMAGANGIKGGDGAAAPVLDSKVVQGSISVSEAPPLGIEVVQARPQEETTAVRAPRGKPAEVLEGEDIQLTYQLCSGAIQNRLAGSLLPALGLQPGSLLARQILHDLSITGAALASKPLFNNYLFLWRQFPWQKARFHVGEREISSAEAARRVASHEARVWSTNPLQTGRGTYFDTVVQAASLEMIARLPNPDIFSEWVHTLAERPTVSAVERFMGSRKFGYGEKSSDKSREPSRHVKIELAKLRGDFTGELDEVDEMEGLLGDYLARLEKSQKGDSVFFQERFHQLIYAGSGKQHADRSLRITPERVLEAFDAFKAKSAAPNYVQLSSKVVRAFMAAQNSPVPLLRVATICRLLLLRSTKSWGLLRAKLNNLTDPDKPFQLGYQPRDERLGEIQQALVPLLEDPSAARERWEEFQEYAFALWSRSQSEGLEGFSIEDIGEAILSFQLPQLGSTIEVVEHKLGEGRLEIRLDPNKDFGKNSFADKKPCGLSISAKRRTDGETNKDLLSIRLPKKPENGPETAIQLALGTKFFIHEAVHVEQGDMVEGSVIPHNFGDYSWMVTRELVPFALEDLWSASIGDVMSAAPAAWHPDGLMFRLGEIEKNYIGPYPLGISSPPGEAVISPKK